MKCQHRRCKNESDNFCYICGSYTLPKQRRNITDKVNQLYLAYFQMNLGNQDKYWDPHIIYQTCLANLSACGNGKRKSMGFLIPMIWRDPKDHVTDFYFCLVITNGFNGKNKAVIKYPNLQSAMLPITDCNEIPIPNPMKPINQDEKFNSNSPSILVNIMIYCLND